MLSSTRGVNKQETQTWELVPESMIDDDVGLRLVATKGNTIDGDVSLASKKIRSSLPMERMAVRACLWNASGIQTVFRALIFL
jgi:hypothetical protein